MEAGRSRMASSASPRPRRAAMAAKRVTPISTQRHRVQDHREHHLPRHRHQVVVEQHGGEGQERASSSAGTLHQVWRPPSRRTRRRGPPAPGPGDLVMESRAGARAGRRQVLEADDGGEERSWPAALPGPGAPPRHLLLELAVEGEKLKTRRTTSEKRPMAESASSVRHSSRRSLSEDGQEARTGGSRERGPPTLPRGGAGSPEAWRRPRASGIQRSERARPRAGSWPTGRRTVVAARAGRRLSSSQPVRGLLVEPGERLVRDQGSRLVQGARASALTRCCIPRREPLPRDRRRGPPAPTAESGACARASGAFTPTGGREEAPLQDYSRRRGRRREGVVETTPNRRLTSSSCRRGSSPACAQAPAEVGLSVRGE